jgi:hypothetical protein
MIALRIRQAWSWLKLHQTLAVTIVSLLACCLIVALYWHRLHYKAGLPLSDASADWGTFGDYVGGILGTIFSGAAFLAIFLTHQFQKRQETIQELQRLLATIAGVIDAMLDSPLPEPRTRMSSSISPSNPPILLRSDVYWRVQDFMEGEADSKGSSQHSQADAAYAKMNSIAAEIGQLVLCLSEYARSGGSEFIRVYYTNRYTSCVQLLHSHGIPFFHATRMHFSIVDELDRNL